MKRLLVAIAALHVGVVPAAAQSGRGLTAETIRPVAREWRALFAAEDARAATEAQLDLLYEAVRSPVPVLRQVAVRALGRLERADQVLTIAPLLYDSVVDVRVAAAYALAQAVHRGGGGAARTALQHALGSARESPPVLAAVAESYARIRGSDISEGRAAVQALLPHMVAPAEARLGVLRGFYFLSRQPGMRPAFDSAAIASLRAEVGNAASADETAARARTLAHATLTSTGGADARTITTALGDGAPLVRREAVLAAGALQDTAAARRILHTALTDRSSIVRYDALRIHSRRFAGSGGCDGALRGVRDANPNVALLAIDQLGSVCSADPRVTGVLDSIAATIGTRGVVWQPAAHAAAALATLDSAAARRHLRALQEHRNMFARAWAARVAATLRDTASLRVLALDERVIVRSAAIPALSQIAGHAADELYITQLSSDDSELLMAAAAALEKSTRPGTAAALLDALDRVTGRRSETSRDGRMALIARVRELGDSTLTRRLTRYLRDFDADVANAAAETIEKWTGRRPETSPQPLPPLELPAFDELARLESARVMIEMEGGAAIELRLLPFVAPTNAFRFARLARDGYFNGLTFHRIAPNFVIQGGSPRANEYSGDALFSRDEVGAANWRGTVGLSTRGRDTGDAQIYINVIDNVRLDHDYTVYAEVVAGMEVVDALREGDVIRRVRVR